MDLNIAKAEKMLITAALVSYENHRSNAAKALGISQRTLYRKLQEYGLENFSPKLKSPKRPKRQLVIDLNTGKVVGRKGR